MSMPHPPMEGFDTMAGTTKGQMMGEAQPSQIRIPEDKYIEVLEAKLADERRTADQQQAVILALMSDIQTLTDERDQYAESLRQAWVDNEEKEDASSSDS